VKQADWFNLTNNEEVVFADHPSIWTSVSTIIAGALVSLAALAGMVLFYEVHGAVILGGLLLFLGGIGTAAFAEVKRRHHWYLLTNERLMKKRGWYSWDTREARYEKIQDVTVRVSVRERLLGYGDIAVTTASGAETTEFRLEDVPEPAEMSNLISEYKDKAIERKYHRGSEESTFEPNPESGGGT